ncbi:outer membrane biogenesis protein BamB [Stieleria neptunia]|uniref:Outer membrane biogenesis protein BamB n=1 Tax=Stieleria neptunia TaxID=2527979 RepID=A0A518I405_9BACT|nr:PQQ-binding-like beta-propeller repeat protein [Stieleria neptunia]QDV47804.1 outer membrane biogenesis protein BamB [Stieleria neptunia]
MITPPRYLFVVLLGGFITTTTCLAEYWTEFRGPGGQGHSGADSLPLSWSETEHIAWKIPIEGDGWSSPVVADGKIYLTTATPLDGDADKARSLRALCIRADDGRILWNKEVFIQSGDGVQMHKKNSHASATPVLEGDRLYVHFGPSGTACLSTDGEMIWTTDALQFRPVHGNGGSPVLYNETLIVTCDGGDQQFVAGISAASGDVKWKTERRAEVKKGFSFSTPMLIEVDGQPQAVCPGSGAVVAYDPETGAEIWSVDYDEGYSVVPRPVFANGLVFVSSGYDSASLYAIDPSGRGDVTDSHVRWTLDKGVPKTPSMLAVGDELYFVDDGGVASCVDATTGKLHWKERLGGKYSASPFYGAGRIYFQSETGKTTVIAPGKKYNELAVNDLGDSDRTFASFAVIDEAILLRSETQLYRIETE